MRIFQRIGLVAFLSLGVAVSDTFAQVKPLKDPDPQRFARQIQKFAEADKRSPPKEGVTVFVGSSSIRRWNLPKYFGKLAAINRGFGGSQISDIHHFAQKVVLKYKPKKIIFYCGAATSSSPEPRRLAIVPRHREVAVGTLRSVLRQAGLTQEEFEAL